MQLRNSFTRVIGPAVDDEAGHRHLLGERGEVEIADPVVAREDGDTVGALDRGRQGCRLLSPNSASAAVSETSGS